MEKAHPSAMWPDDLRTDTQLPDITAAACVLISVTLVHVQIYRNCLLPPLRQCDYSRQPALLIYICNTQSYMHGGELRFL